MVALQCVLLTAFYNVRRHSVLSQRVLNNVNCASHYVLSSVRIVLSQTQVRSLRYFNFFFSIFAHRLVVYSKTKSYRTGHDSNAIIGKV